MDANVLCPICYENYILPGQQLACGQPICELCLANWVASSVQIVPQDRISRKMEKFVRFEMKCVSSECSNLEPGCLKHILTYQECVEFLQKYENKVAFEIFSLHLLEMTMKEHKNVRQCPNKSCTYFGTIDPSVKCNRELECEKCYCHWKDSVCYSISHKIKEEMSIFSWKHSYSHYLASVLLNFGCPSCDQSTMRLNRNGRIIDCICCEHSFCTKCGNGAQSPIHQNKFYCYLGVFLMIFWNLYIISFTINLKISIIVKDYGQFWIVIATNVIVFILANLYFFSILFVILFYLKMKRTPTTTLRNRIIRATWLCITVLYPPVWITVVVLSLVYIWFFQNLGIIFGVQMLIILTIYSFLWVVKKCNQCRLVARQNAQPVIAANQGAVNAQQNQIQQPLLNQVPQQPPNQVNQNDSSESSSDEDDLEESPMISPEEDKEENKEEEKYNLNSDRYPYNI
ncbi:unnamed protein product [Moneuplotes crassus]|uniref:Uncharacterized protein n=1 Tax=Euplotes crassus TaxID=5936 RepID=A0AAD1U6B9_EUPCR|nr:unnamed protein product [Moneuplotes crassus]